MILPNFENNTSRNSNCERIGETSEGKKEMFSKPKIEMK